MKKMLLCFLCLSALSRADESVESLGERLFNDVRFSQYFYELSGGNVNFRAESLSDNKAELFTSCASCHLVDQKFSSLGGMRGYNDFLPRTPLPYRTDGKKTTLRNTPTLVGIGSKYAQNRFSHYDGEFADHSGTVLGNFTGRNMGWLADDSAKALKNIVRIIREDNGHSDLAREFGGSYRKILLGVDPSLTNDLRLPYQHRVDIDQLTDEEVIDLVVKFVTAYLDGIDFEKDSDGVYQGAAYDQFLKLNGLPLEPSHEQSVEQYTLELMSELAKLKNPKFIKPFFLETHKKEFEFQESEWQGLRIFFNITKAKSMGAGRGMCLNCHMPPLFTDQRFHNVGVTQQEYDQTHGAGSFMQMDIPDLAQRGENVFFLEKAVKQDKGLADLGLWNFFGRKNKKELTRFVTQTLCPSNADGCTPGFLLPFTIGRMKTPTLRNLNHSGPYFHNGQARKLADVMNHYQEVAQLMRQKKLRNGALQLRRLNLSKQDKKDLVAFLNSLNSNYD